MSKLQDIKDQVALEKRGVRFDTLLYELYPDDTYVYEVDRWDIDEIMSEAARRYATVIAEDVRKRAAERARTHKVANAGSFRDAAVDKVSILSTPINLDL